MDEQPDYDNMTAGELLQSLADADNNIATINGQLKDAKSKYDVIVDKVFALMDAQETETIRNSKVGLQATATESTSDVIEDWDAFVAFVLRRKAPYLFQRRLSPKAVEEMVESQGGKPIPGLGKFTKRRLSVTKISK